MSNYDASIRINTKVDTSQMQKLQIQIDKAKGKVSELAQQYENFRNKKIPTAEYSEISNQISRATIEFDKLIAKQDEMIALGRNSGSAWDALQYKLEEAGNTIRFAKGELQDLIESGKAFTMPSSVEVEKMGQDLSYARAELNALNTKHNELYEKQLKSEGSTKRNTKEYRKMGTTGSNAIDKINRKAKKSNNLMKTMAARFKGIALSLLIFNWISKGFNALISSFKEGFQNLSKYSKETNKNMSELKGQTETFKNGLASAFVPIINIVVPWLSQLVSWLNTTTQSLSRFFAVLTGKKFYTVAKKQTVDYAKSLDSAKKSAEGALAAFDDLNVLDQKNASSGDGGVSSGGTIFEDIPIENGIPDFISSLAEAIKKGDWYSVGSLLVNKLNESINGIDWKQAGRDAGGRIDSFFSGLRGFLDGYDSSAVSRSISDYIINFLETVDWTAAAQTTVDLFCEAFKTLFETGFNIGKWIYEKITGEDIDLTLDEAITQIIESIKDGSWKGALKLWWDDIKKSFKNFCDGVDRAFLKWIDSIFYQIGQWIGKVNAKLISFALDINLKIAKFFKGIIDGFIELARRIGEIIGGILDAIASIFTASNGEINIDFKGGSKQGGNKLKMATGGIVSRPINALIGEAGKEAVLPLETNTDWMDILADRINPTSNRPVYLQVEGKTFAKIMGPYFSKENSRIGTTLRTT